MAQVWKKWRDLRHQNMSKPDSRRRSPTKNLTCAKIMLDLLQNHARPAPRNVPSDRSGPIQNGGESESLTAAERK